VEINRKLKMKTLLLTFNFILSSALIVFSQELKIGDAAPDFSATADNGETWNSKEFKGKKNIVVYFYPAAMTGGCTAQACAYRDLSNDLGEVDAMVVGISGDNVEGLKFFKKTQNLNFTLLSDEKGEIAKIFGVPTRDGGTLSREFEGQTFELTRGVTASRWTYIIDKKGNIVYKNEQVDAAKDTEQVLSYLKNNS
jgi:thioredoxin-dependent peroxiredoxin